MINVFGRLDSVVASAGTQAPHCYYTPVHIDVLIGIVHNYPALEYTYPSKLARSLIITFTVTLLTL